MSILELVVKNLLMHDNGDYRSALSILSRKYSQLKVDKIASRRCSKEVLQSCEIVVKAAIKADELSKQKTAGLLNKVLIKTLKIAQAALALFLLKSPFRIGLAYNALHNVIKFLEREEKKEKLKKV